MNPAMSAAREEYRTALSAIVGPQSTIVSDRGIIVSPENTQQLSSILVFSKANDIEVMPTGSGTKLDWGNPVHAGIRINLGRLRALREHVWQDMTCTVEAGCTWAALQGELARHGQMIALDPLWPERATVGGVVATNDSGTLRHRYGALSDLIIGMTVVLADGTISKTGGKVVKNVAGYDLQKLMTGSFGTLGVIAEVNFRLHPRPATVQTWTTIAPDRTNLRAAQFEPLLRSLFDSQLEPCAVQLRTSSREAAVDVQIATPLECLDEQESRLRKVSEPFQLGRSSESVWQARESIFGGPDTTVLKASTLPADLSHAVSEVQHWVAERDLEASIVAQATGIMTIAFFSNPDSARSLIEFLRRRLKTSQGSVVVLKATTDLRKRIDVWGSDSNALSLMREIKRRFDPTGILNSGRFVGNI